MTEIKPLPLEIINLIAAGEVIDSLASVVRELIENSLDAGADRLGINLFPSALKVRVADNGKGMTLEDLQFCAKAHHTSKIAHREDLWQIRSLGFRGEALHSISQVGTLEIFSFAQSTTDPVGWRVLYQQGEPIAQEAVAIAPGTIVTVSELFQNYPVRQKNLPKINQQIKTIEKIIYDTALTHPQVTWRLWKDQQPWFNLTGGPTAKALIPQIILNTQISDLQELTQNIQIPTAPHSSLNLILGLPDRCDRPRPDWIKIGVNGRIVKLPELEHTVLKTMERTLRRDRYPVAFVHLKTQPDQIDWNRHPAKTEIYLQHLPLWQEEITIAIEKALTLSPLTLPNALHNSRVGKLLKAAEATGAYNLTAPSTPTNNQPKIGLMDLKAIAQVRNTYIVAEYSEGMWLVEQHIAHERVLFEKLEDNWQLIELDQPLILDKLQEKQMEQLAKIGIKIENFGKNLWKILNIPQALAEREDQKEALLEISYGGDLETAQVATACRTAIRNGTPLTIAQMQNLLDQWKMTRHPRTCPHGRPIYLALEESALARFFRRHWVIGKSHGI